jgi:hypothetical protein
MIPTTVRRGDVIVVGRIFTWRAWLRSPLACAISWRIQRSTRSSWNHVACYLGGGAIAEAEWNRGVRVALLRPAYLTGDYRIAIVRPPDAVSRATASATWQTAAAESRGIRSYSLRTLILMRVAALLFGAEGIRDVVRNHPGDGAWICSELAAHGWAMTPSFRRARDLLVTPADFMDPAIGRELGLERILVQNPKTLALEQ